jgi:formylmethanofuran dehydrogenase subunit E
LTGCTFGKGNLIYLDYGKNAFTFIRRSDGKAIRVVSRPDIWGRPDPEQQALSARVWSSQGTEEDRAKFKTMQEDRMQAILTRPIEELFDIQVVKPEVPARARIHNSVTCAGCGEQVMETRAHLFRGDTYCLPCFEARDRRYA